MCYHDFTYTEKGEKLSEMSESQIRYKIKELKEENSCLKKGNFDLSIKNLKN